MEWGTVGDCWVGNWMKELIRSWRLWKNRRWGWRWRGSEIVLSEENGNPSRLIDEICDVSLWKTAKGGGGVSLDVFLTGTISSGQCCAEGEPWWGWGPANMTNQKGRSVCKAEKEGAKLGAENSTPPSPLSRLPISEAPHFNFACIVNHIKTSEAQLMRQISQTSRDWLRLSIGFRCFNCGEAACGFLNSSLGRLEDPRSHSPSLRDAADWVVSLLLMYGRSCFQLYFETTTSKLLESNGADTYPPADQFISHCSKPELGDKHTTSTLSFDIYFGCWVEGSVLRNLSLIQAVSLQQVLLPKPNSTLITYQNPLKMPCCRSCIQKIDISMPSRQKWLCYKHPLSVSMFQSILRVSAYTSLSVTFPRYTTTLLLFARMFIVVRNGLNLSHLVGKGVVCWVVRLLRAFLAWIWVWTES